MHKVFKSVREQTNFCFFVAELWETFLRNPHISIYLYIYVFTDEQVLTFLMELLLREEWLLQPPPVINI